MILAGQQERIENNQVQKGPAGNIRVQAAPDAVKDYVGVVVDALMSNGFDVIDVSNEKYVWNDNSLRNVYIVAREADQEGENAASDD